MADVKVFCINTPGRFLEQSLKLFDGLKLSQTVEL